MPEIFERSYTMNIQEKMEKYLGKAVSQADNKEIYHALLNIVQEMAAEKERTARKKFTISRQNFSLANFSPII